MQRGEARGAFDVQRDAVVVAGHAALGGVFPMADKLTDLHADLFSPVVAGVLGALVGPCLGAGTSFRLDPIGAGSLASGPAAPYWHPAGL
ncbi:hypothetical protein CRPA11_03090 [Pseudomonas aeruginosa]